jgi:hypothetical protein
VAIIDLTEIDQLVNPPSTPCVSVYMPTHRVTPDITQDRLRLKNLLTDAEERLIGLGLRGPTAKEIVGPGRELIGDDDFWLHRRDGLALFLSPGYSWWLRPPLAFPEVLEVTDRFCVRPLLPALWPDQKFYVLAISRDGNRLLRGARWEIEEVKMTGVPANMAEMLAPQGIQPGATMKTGTSRSPSAGAFHGHGLERDVTETRIIDYLRAIDRGASAAMRKDPAPLVLAAVEHGATLFRETTEIGDIVGQTIEGNPTGLSAEELHDKAWALVEPRAFRHRDDALDRYPKLEQKQRATRGFDVLKAAIHGRIDTLFVAERDGYRRGTFDAASGEVEVHNPPQPHDEDLLDLAAVYAIRQAGTVYVLPNERMPGGELLAALLRF